MLESCGSTGILALELHGGPVALKNRGDLAVE